MSGWTNGKVGERQNKTGTRPAPESCAWRVLTETWGLQQLCPGPVPCSVAEGELEEAGGCDLPLHTPASFLVTERPVPAASTCRVCERSGAAGPLSLGLYLCVFTV